MNYTEFCLVVTLKVQNRSDIQEMNSTQLERYLNQTFMMYQMYQEEERDFYLQQIVIFVAYMSIFVVAITSNAMVCYVIYANRKLHTETNFLIANLTVSDFLLGLYIPFNIVQNLYYDWIFGYFLCHLGSMMQVISM